MTDRGRLERLQGASHDSRVGNHAAVIEALEAEPDDIGPMGHAMLLAARAVMAEREGQPAEATSLMEEALALGVALPHVMQEMARFFARTDQPMLAHYAFLMADTVGSAGLVDLAAEQEPDELSRYAAWGPAQLADGRGWCHEASGPASNHRDLPRAIGTCLEPSGVASNVTESQND